MQTPRELEALSDETTSMDFRCALAYINRLGELGTDVPEPIPLLTLLPRKPDILLAGVRRNDRPLLRSCGSSLRFLV
jgi:hypothetical protein